MIYQQVVTDHSLNGKLFNFMDFRMKKPFFKKPIKITIGAPINQTYFLLKNIVYMEKQILALQTEQDPYTIVLVEAKIEDGELTQVSMLPEELIGGVSSLFAGVLNAL